MSWIVRTIAARGGQVSFREYMDMALYDPCHGYYASSVPRYGRGGDFLTAPTASPWYGRLLARFSRGLAQRLGPVRIVDVAAGDGTLIENMLDDVAQAPRGIVPRMVSVERSEAMRRRQRERFKASGRDIEILSTVDDIEIADGVVMLHASELYDALPVHLVRGGSDGLVELWIGIEGDRLVWTDRPAPEDVVDYLRSHGITLEPEQMAEVDLGAEPLHRRILGLAGGPGVAVTLDYGYPASRLYNPRGRFGGSLACYREHELSRDPLAFPGEQDITSHVNWDDLRRAAESAGWREVGLWSLAEFLVRAGLEGILEERGLGMEADLDADTVAERQEIKRLLDPDGMGADLKVLVQATPDAAAAVEEVLRLEIPRLP